MRETVGPYRIDRKLGEGGMGVVYAAHDQRLDRPVALKMLRAAPDDAQARERLRREARAAASVNHPHVCQVYDIGEDGGEMFVAMELLEGEPLSARLARGALPLDETVRHRLRGAARARRAAPARRRPSRSEAVEHLPDAARRQAARLRPGAADAGGDGRHADEPDGAGRDPRHAELHGAGTGARRDGRRARRSVHRRAS